MVERIVKKQMQRPQKLLTPFAAHMVRIRKSLGDEYTQEKLAAELGVQQSTVAKWENDIQDARSKSKSKPKRPVHEPSAEILVKFAALLAGLGDRYEDDCIWLLNIAGVASNDHILGVLERRLNRRIEPQRTKPGEIIKVPLIEVIAGEPAAGSRAARGATCDVPAWSVPDPASIICARLSWGLFPFEAGALVVVDRWVGDFWDLVEQGPLVAVHFTRYAELVGLGLSQSEIQRMLKKSTQVNLAELEKQQSVRREAEEQYGGLSAAERTVRDDVQRAFESKPSKRWTPDERGTILFEVIQAGWLRLELANDPDFAVESRVDWSAPDRGPWRLVLQGAGVAGVTRGRGFTVPLTVWETSDWQARPPVPLVGKRILGRVISWMSQAPAHGASPIGTKSRREPK
jgi:transcriptional regulator with XRE-family HTH domain